MYRAEGFNRTMILRMTQYATEHQKDLDTSMSILTFACDVQVHRPKKLLPFSPENTRLTSGSIAIARPMPREDSQIDSQLTYRLRLIQSSAY